MSLSKLSKIVKKLNQIGIKVRFKVKVIPLIKSVNPNLFDNRIGMLLLSTDFFQVAKLLSLDIATTPRNTKLKQLNASQWNSEYVYNKYHAGQSHVPSIEFPTGNQKREFKAVHPDVC